ncbi:MAG: hypothetical protein KAJ86_02565 [Alphaproteobacteria bacterium]|nr:hypothetical protein [Alphaproteobacteria bacterium]
MKFFIFFLSVFVFFVDSSVYAQEVVFESICKELPQQNSDNNADYIPGVDINGNPVEFADINGILKNAIYPIEIPIELRILKLLDLELSPVLKDAIDLDPMVAMIVVYEDGRIEYNGEDISDRVAHRCLDAEKGTEAQKIAKEASVMHGHNNNDVLVSDSENSTEKEIEEVREQINE